MYSQAIVIIETLMSFLFTAVLTAMVVMKISRPSRLTRRILFSRVAVVDFQALHYQNQIVDLQELSRPIPEQFVFGKYPVLTMRCANTRRPQLVDTALRLLLLRHETLDGKTARQLLDEDESLGEDSRYKGDFNQIPPTITFIQRFRELDFDLTHQKGRVRGLSYPMPQLPLPWTINHTLDPSSPLHGIDFSRITDHPLDSFEVIIVLDGVDEAVSMSIQARWSYLPQEIIWNARFVGMVTVTQKSRYEIDYAQISEFVKF